MSELGPFHPYHPEACLPATIWQKAVQARYSIKSDTGQTPPEEVLLLIKARQAARQINNWVMADELRQQIVKLGWEIIDTKDGIVSK